MSWRFHEDVPMSMKRVRDMADPELAQDAATRKYVDDKVGTGTGSDEVFIQNEQPIEAGAELWLDLDEPTPEFSVDEVFVQDAPPAESSAVLWVDTTDAGRGGMSLIQEVLAEIGRLREEIDTIKGGG
jgi:hypothetical protein